MSHVSSVYSEILKTNLWYERKKAQWRYLEIMKCKATVKSELTFRESQRRREDEIQQEKKGNR